MPSAGDSGPALRLEAVHRRFRIGRRHVTALDGISAAAPRGGVTGVIGPDGAGKTTLMRLIAGLLQADAGTIEVLGTDVARDPQAVQARLGYMPQRFGLYEDLTVQENLDLYADLRDVPRATRSARYDELLHMTGLGPFRGRMAGHLSGGMKQKLGLACTLVQPPALLLLDEPTAGVDPVSRRELWQIVQHLVRDARTTVLFSTSYLDEAERCDMVLLLHEGRLLSTGPPATFRDEMAGCCFFAEAGVDRRQLQTRIAGAPGVIDAVVHGGRVRVVTADAPALGAAVPGLDLTPAPPRFEDSFVAQLRRTRDRSLPNPSDPLPPTAGNDGDGGNDEDGGTPPPAGSAAGEPIILVDRVTRRFGDFAAVDGVSFEVRRGEIFGLLGANGAGKSTTFRMLCGLLPPSEGRLRVAGFDLRRAAARARGRIGYMAQKFSLYSDLSVEQNLQFFSSAYRLAGARRQDRIAWAVAEFGLEPMLKVTARDLSLGYKQRLALACALMHEPDILFLDEPTSGVDPLARREFWHRIIALAGAGVTVLVTTHFMEEAEYCDRLVIMAQGRVLTEGTPAAIRDAARHDGRPEPTMEDAFLSVVEGAAA